MTTLTNSAPAASCEGAVTAHIEPCRDTKQLRAYIDTYWRKDHILARDLRMFDFQYATPWVDREAFPLGVSVLCVYDGDRMLGFLGAIAAPYPLPCSYWLALWHVLPELKGSGMGGQLLKTMQTIAQRAGGWIGTFGAGPEALPVYLKRGYCVRAVRRWVLPDINALRSHHLSTLHDGSSRWNEERDPPRAWIDYRYAHHPIFQYEISGESVFRIEQNQWGVVVHACRLVGDWRDAAINAYERASEQAAKVNAPMLMDAWAFECPGPGWNLAEDTLPSVFHPPAARGNLIYAVGYPFIPANVQKGDCDQDRPN